MAATVPRASLFPFVLSAACAAQWIDPSDGVAVWCHGDRSFVGEEEQPKWRLVPVEGDMNELFAGEDILVESSDPEDDEELSKQRLYIYESWLQETARKQGLVTRDDGRGKNVSACSSGMETQEAEALLMQANQESLK